MRNRDDGPSGWVALLCAVLFMWAAIWLYTKDKDCQSSGGVLVRGVGYECVKLERIPEKKP